MKLPTSCLAVAFADWIDGFPSELRAGMLLETFDGHLILVGHVNEDNGGKCGCCAEFDYGQGPKVIRRHRIALEFSELPQLEFYKYRLVRPA